MSKNDFHSVIAKGIVVAHAHIRVINTTGAPQPTLEQVMEAARAMSDCIALIDIGYRNTEEQTEEAFANMLSWLLETGDINSYAALTRTLEFRKMMRTDGPTL